MQMTAYQNFFCPFLDVIEREKIRSRFHGKKTYEINCLRKNSSLLLNGFRYPNFVGLLMYNPVYSFLN